MSPELSFKLFHHDVSSPRSAGRGCSLLMIGMHHDDAHSCRPLSLMPCSVEWRQLFYARRQWKAADSPGTILTYYSDKLIRKSGLLAHTDFYTVLPLTILKQSIVSGAQQLALTHLPSQQEQRLFLLKSPLKKNITHVLLNFRGSFLCVFSSYRFDKRLKNSVLKTDSSKLSYSCSCRMKTSSCIVLKRNQSIYHSDIQPAL